MWSSVKDWPLIAIHLVLLPDGRVLNYGTNSAGPPDEPVPATGYFIYDVWTPSLGFGSDSHLTLPNQTRADIFCSSQLVLPQQNAGVLITGGDTLDDKPETHKGNKRATLFNYSSNSLKLKSDMLRGRFYSTATTLPDGQIYVQGGSSGEDHPEIRGRDGTFRLLTGIDTTGFQPFYPRNFVAPDGRVFGFEEGGTMYYVDPKGTGSVTEVGTLSAQYRGEFGTAAMFRPGRILEIGQTSRTPVVIDITGDGPPEVTPTDFLSAVRDNATATLLADGQVLLTGGSGVHNQLVGVTNQAEIWNPETGQWQVGAEGTMPRLYHSTALLLPDATVLVAGGGANGPLANFNAEIYYPPYLFNDSGELAERPTITDAPSTLDVGTSFRVEFSHERSIKRVGLVKTGSVTHSWNMDQRYVDLPFSDSDSQLTAQMPSRATDVPPGYYLLFLVDANGVPSKAKTVFVNVAGEVDTDQAPTLVNPGDQFSAAGDDVRIALEASDPDRDAVSFSATGLPPRLTINRATGVISGKPITAGTFNTVISVSDGRLSASVNFSWIIGSTEEPIELDPLPPSVPAVAGDAITFRAHASGRNTRYTWDFDDGTPESDSSSSGEISHEFAEPGLYFVTVFAADPSGLRTQKTFMQIVHLQLTEQSPAVSSNLAFEMRAGAASRVWLVNQDANSVSVFSARQRTKIAEIAVQEAPRSIAIANDGSIWVTNKRSASISVIDPETLAVTTTIPLPRASQPHGLAMSPVGDRAYVVLEATGRLQAIRIKNRRPLGHGVKLGPHPRDVSISGDGAIAYVSRYITPPQPGESTATVGTTQDGLPTGGEVVRVRLSDGKVIGTTILVHSERADFETQGRGVPNYLGATVVSPDGTQAWVASKQDNIQRGSLRDGNHLSFANTVRAIASRIDLSTGQEDSPARMDMDNAGLASAAAFDPLGVVLFVALETSREVAVLDAHRHRELFRFEVGRAPEGLALSRDGLTLYVNNFMDRTLGVFDLRPLLVEGTLEVIPLGNIDAVGAELLTPQVLLGKQLFYDARDPRLAADRYISCASCHNDGGHDGRTWDFTGAGEGLRNTISLRGHVGEGFLHWSNNFDEVQDFELQIRTLSGGIGLMDDRDIVVGTRDQPLGTPKAGVSPDLDALAAYVTSLDAFDLNPNRTRKAGLRGRATKGRAVFDNNGCVSCHAGAAFTASGFNTLVDIGTLKPASGKRLGGALTGIDVPTLRDVWSTAPYLHDGSAATLEDAIAAHNGSSVAATDMPGLVAFVSSIGPEEAAPAIPPGDGVGLRGVYYNNVTLTPPAVLTRTEAVNFNWPRSPGPGVAADQFSVRWTGTLKPPTTGSYRFRAEASDGVRVTIDGNRVIDRWKSHAARPVVTSDFINLVAGQSYRIVVEYYNEAGATAARLQWHPPVTRGYDPIPAERLYPDG